MSKVDLLPDEAIIMRDSSMMHDCGRPFAAISDELVLTNLALIVTHKNLWGSIKDVQRFSLDQVKVVNNNPQVVIGTSQNGERQLHVYFNHGIEAFALGDSDDDAEAGILETLLTPVKEKETRNLYEWQTAISRAVLALPQNSNSEACSTTNSAVSHVISDAGAKSVTVVSNSVTHVTKKCIGCMAPLSGVHGQKAICRYCDTEQVL